MINFLIAINLQFKKLIVLQITLLLLCTDACQVPFSLGKLEMSGNFLGQEKLMKTENLMED